MARKKSILVRVSDEEEEQIKAKAAEAKMNVSSYLRWIACEGTIKVYDMKAVNDLIVQVSRIGTNINQIATMVNQTKSVYRNDIGDLKKQLDKMEKELNEFLKIFKIQNEEM